MFVREGGASPETTDPSGKIKKAPWNQSTTWSDRMKVDADEQKPSKGHVIKRATKTPVRLLEGEKKKKKGRAYAGCQSKYQVLISFHGFAAVFRGACCSLQQEPVPVRRVVSTNSSAHFSLPPPPCAHSLRWLAQTPLQTMQFFVYVNLILIFGVCFPFFFFDRHSSL